MTPISRETLARLGVRFAAPKAAPKAEAKPVAYTAPWLIAFLDATKPRQDITAKAVAEAAGKSLKTVRAALRQASHARRIRLVNVPHGRISTLYRRTEKAWAWSGRTRPWGGTRKAIAAMRPGTIFRKAEVGGPSQGTSRAVEAALASGIVEVHGVEERLFGVYRRIKP